MTHTQKEFCEKDGSVNLEKAMQAGHEARSAAIRDSGKLVSSALRAAINLIAVQRITSPDRS